MNNISNWKNPQEQACDKVTGRQLKLGGYMYVLLVPYR